MCRRRRSRCRRRWKSQSYFHLINLWPIYRPGRIVIVCETCEEANDSVYYLNVRICVCWTNLHVCLVHLCIFALFALCGNNEMQQLISKLVVKNVIIIIIIDVWWRARRSRHSRSALPHARPMEQLVRTHYYQCTCLWLKWLEENGDDDVIAHCWLYLVCGKASDTNNHWICRRMYLWRWCVSVYTKTIWLCPTDSYK